MLIFKYLIAQENLIPNMHDWEMENIKNRYLSIDYHNGVSSGW